MKRTVKLPDLGEGVARAEVVDLLVTLGESVREDQPLAEVESDKATVQIASPCDGVVAEIFCEAGERLEVGALLLSIKVTDGASTDGDEPAGEPAPGREAGSAPGPSRTGARVQAGREGAIRAAPRTRALASRLNVRLADVAAANRTEVVTEADVLAAADQAAGGVVRRIPLRGVRREIAERLSAASLAPTVTVVEECDFSRAEGLSGYERSAWTAKTTSNALAEHPVLNSTLEGDEVLVHEAHHLAWAVQTKRGLMAPVLRNVQGLTLEELAQAIRGLVRKARAGDLGPGELRGGTFTITDAGRLGGLFATPILNPPQTAIVGIHRVAQRPVVSSGRVVLGTTGLVSCTFDHRAYDGADASAFLLDLIEGLEGGPQ